MYTKKRPGVPGAGALSERDGGEFGAVRDIRMCVFNTLCLENDGFSTQPQANTKFSTPTTGRSVARRAAATPACGEARPS